MGSIRLIQDFIEDELADRRAYLAYAAAVNDTVVRAPEGTGCTSSN